jgi:flagellar biosynthesis protein FlhG
VLAITSGKGGVGKTLTTVHFAHAARKMGLDVTILDGDLGMANVDVVMGLQARYNIKEVLDGNVHLRDIVVEGPFGIKVIPSGSGISGLANLNFIQKQTILDQIDQLDAQTDLILIDTGAGISETVLTLNAAAEHVVVVTTPEPHAMTDAYALIKVLNEERGIKVVSLLVNQARTTEEGARTADRLQSVAARFLDVKIIHAGSIPPDAVVARSVMQRRAINEQTSNTVGGQAWTQVARALISDLLRKKGETDANIWHKILQNEPRGRVSASF